MRKDITSASESKDFPMKIGQGVYVGAATRDTLMQRIFDSKLRQSKNYLYSDLNFALLMAMEEKVTGKKHDEFVEKRVYGPIGATRTCYVPLAKNHKASEIAPTEKDNFCVAKRFTAMCMMNLLLFRVEYREMQDCSQRQMTLENCVRCGLMAVVTAADR